MAKIIFTRFPFNENENNSEERMKVKPISFGKAIKVYGPFHEARRFANAANGDPTVTPDLQKKIQEIINDTNQGHALAFYFNESQNSGYIFSGKESKEYLHSLLIKAREVKKAKTQDPLPIALKKVLQSRYEHYQRTEEIIQNSKEDFALKISKNGEKLYKIPTK